METRRAWRDSLSNIIGVACRFGGVEGLVGAVGKLQQRIYAT
jgi:hypothetical protein